VGDDKKVTAVRLEEWMPREAEGIPCPCGGYADRVDTTPEEREEIQAGGSSPCSPGCCDRAFVCRICKARMFGTAEAPESSEG